MDSVNKIQHQKDGLERAQGQLEQQLKTVQRELDKQKAESQRLGCDWKLLRAFRSNEQIELLSK